METASTATATDTPGARTRRCHYTHKDSRAVSRLPRSLDRSDTHPPHHQHPPPSAVAIIIVFHRFPFSTATAASSTPCKLPTLIPSSLSIPVLPNTLQHRVSNPLANSNDRQNDLETQNFRNHPPLFEHRTHTYPQYPISLPHEMNRKILSSRVSTSTGTPDSSSNTLLWGFLHRFQVKTPNEEAIYPFVLLRSNKRPPKHTPNNKKTQQSATDWVPKMSRRRTTTLSCVGE